MFEGALRKLGQRAFDLDEVELEHLVTTFDTDGNGTVELDEFMAFCLSIPSLPWRAEKARRCGMVWLRLWWYQWRLCFLVCFRLWGVS